MCSVPFFQLGDVLEHEDHLIGIFAKPFRAQPRLIPIARVQRHQQGMNTIGMINSDKPRISFQDSMAVSDGFKRCLVRLTVFREAPRACRAVGLARRRTNESALKIFKINSSAP